MRRIGATTATLAVLAAGLMWAGVPAISKQPPVASPVEFEAALAPAGRSARAARAARTPLADVVRPGRRFNLVGLRWRGGSVGDLRLRSRRDGGEWSRWVRVGVDPDHAPDRRSREQRRARRASDPVWVGQADQVQVRAGVARRMRGLRLHFVNTTGTATGADRFRKRLREIAAGMVSAIGEVFGGAARAQSAQPPIVSREDWGAAACPPRADPSYGEVKAAFVHHTVSTNDYGPDESAAMVLAMCRYHRNSNGWNDIGYNFLVDRYGTIFEGRAGGIGEAVVGAQAQGYNSQSTGIASIGTFSSGGHSEAGLRAVANLLGWKLGLHGVPARGRVTLASGGGSLNRYPAGSRPTFERISGHRDADATACPGDGLYGQLTRLRDMVTPGPPRAATAITAAAARRNVPYGQKALLSLGLTASGAPLAGKRLVVQLLGRLGWRNQYSIRTDAHGRADTRVRVSTNRTLRARYGGESGLLPSSSAPVKVGVRPRVSLALASPDPVRFSGSVRPRKTSAILTLERRTVSGRLVRVSRRSVRLRKGRLRTTLRLRRPALYRARLSVRRDARNLAARSAVVTFRVR